MSSHEVDEYLVALDEPQRSTLSELRRTIKEIIPDAEEIISYGIPGYRLRGQVVAGFAAYQRHLSYFPHSGSVLPALKKDLKQYATSKGTLRFELDTPLPKSLVEKLIAIRIDQAFDTKSRKR